MSELLLRFRLLNTTGLSYTLVPEYQAMYLEELGETTYKHSHESQKLIKKMTKNKEITELTEAEWVSKMGHVYFPKDHHHTQSLVGVTAAAIRKRKATEFVNDVLGDVFGKVTYDVSTGEDTNDSDEESLQPDTSIEDEARGLVEAAEAEEAEAEAEADGVSAIPNSEIFLNKQAVLHRIQLEKNPGIGAMLAIAAKPLMTKEEASKIPNVHICGITGFSKILLVLGALASLSSLHELTKTNGFDTDEWVEFTYFQNPAMYWDKSVDFIKWDERVAQERDVLENAFYTNEGNATLMEECTNITRRIMSAKSEAIIVDIISNLQSDQSPSGKNLYNSVMLNGMTFEQYKGILEHGRYVGGANVNDGDLFRSYQNTHLRLMKHKTRAYSDYAKGEGLWTPKQNGKQNNHYSLFNWPVFLKNYEPAEEGYKPFKSVPFDITAMDDVTGDLYDIPAGTDLPAIPYTAKMKGFFGGIAHDFRCILMLLYKRVGDDVARSRGDLIVKGIGAVNEDIGRVADAVNEVEKKIDETVTKEFRRNTLLGFASLMVITVPAISGVLAMSHKVLHLRQHMSNAKDHPVHGIASALMNVGEVMSMCGFAATAWVHTALLARQVDHTEHHKFSEFELFSKTPMSHIYAYYTAQLVVYRFAKNHLNTGPVVDTRSYNTMVAFGAFLMSVEKMSNAEDFKNGTIQAIAFMAPTVIQFALMVKACMDVGVNLSRGFSILRGHRRTFAPTQSMIEKLKQNISKNR